MWHGQSLPVLEVLAKSCKSVIRNPQSAIRNSGIMPRNADSPGAGRTRLAGLDGGEHLVGADAGGLLRRPRATPSGCWLAWPSSWPSLPEAPTLSRARCRPVVGDPAAAGTGWPPRCPGRADRRRAGRPPRRSGATRSSIVTRRTSASSWPRRVTTWPAVPSTRPSACRQSAGRMRTAPLNLNLPHTMVLVRPLARLDRPRRAAVWMSRRPVAGRRRQPGQRARAGLADAICCRRSTVAALSAWPGRRRRRSP